MSKHSKVSFDTKEYHSCNLRCCSVANDCINFEDDCIGKYKCDDYESYSEMEDMMHPNETHDEFMEHEDF